jgi:hypothetical protein
MRYLHIFGFSVLLIWEKLPNLAAPSFELSRKRQRECLLRRELSYMA